MARTDQPHKLTFDAFVASVTNFSDPINEKHRNLDYSKPETRAAWNGSKSKIPIWCNVHQKFFTQMAANHRALGQGCPECSKIVYKEKRKTPDPISDFKKIHGDLYDYSLVKYVNTHTPVKIICEAHGEFLQKPLSHIQGQGCPSCWQNRKKVFGKSKTKTYRETYAERAAKIHDGKYALLKLPNDSHDHAEFYCPDHGSFSQKAYVHLLGHGCPACGRITSYAQRDVAALVESFGLTVEQDNRTILNGLHIDIWVPSKNIGIEYNGNFWHTEKRVGNKHREKWERATKAGIRLIQMFDFEWLESRNAVENRLKALLGFSDVFAARKCELRSISVEQANSFCKEYHTQGSAIRHKAGYGLFHDNKLVSCMTFGPSRFSNDAWELLRFASKGRVHGAFGRLFAAFLREHAPDSVISYCDLRWGTGKIYEANGFRLDGITPPDYWYANKEKKISRYKAQKRPAGQTEKEWAESMGYEKVLGVGHQRWIWTKPAA